jgi:outer membrane protein assembly factor BamB
MKSLWTLAGLGILLAGDSFGAPPPASAARPTAIRNFDRRHSDAGAGKRLESTTTQPRLPERLTRDIGVQADVHRFTGTAKFVRDLGGLLDVTKEEDDAADETEVNPLATVKQYLKDHESEVGHGADVMKSARVLRDHTSPATGLRTVAWQQQLVGIPVFEGILSASLTDAGGLVALSSQFVKNPVHAAATGPARRRTIDATPKVSVRQAAASAFVSIGESVKPQTVAVRSPARFDWAESQTLLVPGRAPATAELVWLPTTPDSLRLCWRMILQSEGGQLYQVLIDANTGELVVRHGWSHGIAPGVFHVFAGSSPSPLFPGQALGTATNQPLDVSTPGPEFTNQVSIAVTTNAASPAGWINDSAAFTFQHTTIGNNVDAHLDVMDVDPGYDEAIAVPQQARPAGTLSNGVVHFHFAADLGQPPLAATNVPAITNQKAAVVHAFYWANWAHDRLWNLGFNEAAGNFQYDNFQRGGAGNDPVLIDVQNGASLGARNIGFFSASPTDGTPARILLGLWDGPSPERDGAFDTEVLLHEYVHLLSTRRVGHGVGLSSDEARGLGEGWSDFMALCLLSKPGHDFGGAVAYGAFSAYRWTFLSAPLTSNYHYGMRRYPYSTNLSKNPLTFNDLDAMDATGYLTVPVSPAYSPYEPFFFAFEEHSIGEVWAVTLWDFLANMVQKHGFDAGRELVLKTVVEGMSLCPPNPSLLQARDALILADRVLTGGANWNEAWRAFARRGMGWSAPEPVVVGLPRITPAFDLPPSGQLVPGWPFTARNGVRSSPAAGTNAIYVGASDGRLYSLSPTGSTNWVFFPPGLAAFVSTPAVHSDGTIYAKRKNGWVYALHANSAIKWSNRIDSISTASPALATDGTLYVAGNRDLVAFRPDGTVKWRYFAAKTILGSPSIAPDGTVYFGSADGRMHAVEPAAGIARPGWPFQAGKPIASSAAISSQGSIFFGCQNKKVYALNAGTGAKLWEFATSGVVDSSPALGTNDILYVGSVDRRLYALQASNGQVKWSYRTDGPIRSSPAISADGIVYVGSDDGCVYALGADSGHLLYRFKVGGTLTSSPLITSDGTVYIGSSNGKIVALQGTDGPAASDWPMFRREARRLGNATLP